MRTQRGSISPLVIGFVVVVGLLVAVVTDVSAAFLRRASLDATADAAALAATDGLRSEAAYTGGIDDRVAIDPAAARRYVAQYLAQDGASGRYPGLTVSISVVGAAVVVRLTAPLALPFAVPGAAGGTTVTGTAAAVVSVGR
ncbi:MAG: pilus assembly protein TadG-related protein [Marmoricola sp.]